MGNPDQILRQSQTYLREGVQNLVQLGWLRALGGLDRVLAHKLADISIVPEENNTIRRYTHQQLQQ